MSRSSVSDVNDCHSVTVQALSPAEVSAHPFGAGTVRPLVAKVLFM